MSTESTWQEEAESDSPDTVILCYVLSYDDLLAGASAWFVVEPGGSFVLGRGIAPSAGVSRSGPGRIDISDKRASTSHARVERRPADRLGEALLLEDLGSKNGTFVNGAQITGSRRLVDGDLVEVGHALFVVRIVSARHAAALADEERAAPLGPTRTSCPELAAIARDVRRVAPSVEPVLLLGETGTGKEVVARAIHQLSGRRGELVALDCGAIPEPLFESTLFGHKKGSFTGAAEGRVGEIAKAHRGTLFLDEVANLPPASQAKLLRVLEDKTVTAIGGTEALPVDVRIIAATNASIAEERSTFRRDLLTRIAGFVATLPPLRRRREDLGRLVAHVLAEAGAERAAISVAAARKLFGSRLEGNVRELRAVLRSAQLVAHGGVIDLHHLAMVAAPAESPADVVVAAPDSGSASARGRDLGEASVRATLKAHRGNVVQAARELGTHARQLYRIIDRFGIDLADLRTDAKE